MQCVHGVVEQPIILQRTPAVNFSQAPTTPTKSVSASSPYFSAQAANASPSPSAKKEWTATGYTKTAIDDVTANLPRDDEGNVVIVRLGTARAVSANSKTGLTTYDTHQQKTTGTFQGFTALGFAFTNEGGNRFWQSTRY